MKSGSAEFGSVGSAFGAKTVTQTTAQMPVHTHIQDQHAHSSWGGYNFITDLGPGTAVNTAAGGNYGFRTHYNWVAYATATNQNAGGGQAMGIIQPTRAALLVIKT